MPFSIQIYLRKLNLEMTLDEQSILKSMKIVQQYNTHSGKFKII